MACITHSLGKLMFLFEQILFYISYAQLTTVSHKYWIRQWEAAKFRIVSRDFKTFYFHADVEYKIKELKKVR